MPITHPAFPTSLRSFLGKSQLELTPDSDRQDVSKANDAALQQAIQASLEHDDGLTAAQKFARETGDPETIARANQEAVDEAIRASLAQPQQKAEPPRRLIPDEEYAAQSGLIAKLKAWLSKHGFIVRPNSGDQNNCLLISMLQHVTGNYSRDSKALHKAAERYKALVVDWSDGKERSSSSLFSDDMLTELLVEQINQDYFGARRDLYIQFRFITASLDGEPAERHVGNGPRIMGIIDGGGHYEAFVKRPGAAEADGLQVPR